MHVIDVLLNANAIVEKQLHSRIEVLQATIQCLEKSNKALEDTIAIMNKRIDDKDKIIADLKEQVSKPNEYCHCEPIDQELEKEDFGWWCLTCGKEYIYEPNYEPDYEEDN